MRKFSWMLLVLLVLVGCGEEITKEEEKPKVKVVETEPPPPDKKPEYEKVSDDEILWHKDKAKMMLIPAGSFEMGDHDGQQKAALPVHSVELDGFLWVRMK